MKLAPTLPAMLLLMVTALAWPAPPPATAPAPGEIKRLVTQLGDDDFATREAAGRRLKEIGKPALDALKEATKSDDPEVKTRAGALVQRIERPLPPGWADRDRGFLAGGLSVSVRDDNKIVDVTDGGMKIHIEQGPGGIEMSVTGRDAGEERTQVYKAKDAEQLKSDSPEAFSLYDKWSGGAGPGWVFPGGAVGGGGIIIQGGGRLILGPPPRISGDDLAGLRVKIEQQMKQAKLADESREKVIAQLDEMAQTQTIDPNAPADEREKKVKEFLDQCDDLRKILAELKLPDPGEALPPAAKTRLGISLVERADIDAPGPIVDKVIEGSRGAKLGLQSGDVIQKVNGQEVKSVGDLRKAVSEAKKPLVIEGLRDNEAMKLQEK